MNSITLCNGARPTIGIWHGEFGLSVGSGLHGPVPPDLQAALQDAMTYTRLVNCDRNTRYDPITGEGRRFRPEVVQLFAEEEGGRLACPSAYLVRVMDTCRELGYEIDFRDVKFEGNPDDRPEAFEFDADRLVRYFDPRSEKQIECISAIAANWYGQIDAATAFGKTRIVGALCLAYPNAEHILVVPSKEVAFTAYDHLLEYIPGPDLGMVGGGKDEHRRVSIYIINSLAQRQMMVRPDFLWADECDGYVTDKWAEAIMIAGRRARVFGLSASLVPRFDGAHHRLESLFGKVIFRITHQEATADGLVLPVQVLWHDVVLPRNPAHGLKLDVARKRHAIWYNADRNDLIARVVMDYPQDTKVLIVVDAVAHALELARRIPQAKICAGKISEKLEERVLEPGIVSADRVYFTDRERREVTQEFMHGDLQVLIGTDTLSRGFSPDAVSVLVRADGRKSGTKSVQIPGRVCRLHGQSGKQFGVVHDFLDQFDERFQNNARSRQLDYAKLGFHQVRTRDGSVIKPRIKKVI